MCLGTARLWAVRVQAQVLTLGRVDRAGCAFPTSSLSSAHLKGWWVKSGGVEARGSARMGRARWRDDRAF